MKIINDNRGVVGLVEIGLIAVTVGIVGFTMWKITSTETTPSANQNGSSTTAASVVAPTVANQQLAQTAQLIDVDKDGIPLCTDVVTTGCETKALDSDFDNDGTPDATDPDIDNDGIVNEQDTDNDNDGVKDSDEVDSDNDGIKDSEDVDKNNDGVKDSESGSSNGSSNSSDSSNSGSANSDSGNSGSSTDNSTN